MKAKMMIYGLEDTIDQKINITVSNDMQRVLGINPNILTAFSPEDHSSVRKGGLGSERVNEIPTEYLVVDAKEEGEEGSSSVLFPERSLSYEIFQDPTVAVNVGALKYNRKRTFEFTYYNQSKSKIDSLVQKIMSYDIYNYGQKKHKLEYHYDLPQNLLFFLDHVRQLKNNRLEDNEKIKDLPDYIIKHSQQQISRTNINSSLPYKFNLSIRENLYDVIGMVESETYDVKKEKGENGYWYFTITYSIWYPKPVMLALRYPLLIWNQPLDAKYTKVTTRPEVRAPVQGKTSPMYTGLYELGIPYTKMKRIGYHQHLTIPLADEFYNWPENKMYKNVCSLLVVVDDKNPYSVFNIKHLPHYTIKDPFLKYLLDHPETISETYGGLFQLLLYRNGDKDYRNPIKMDKEGNVTTEFPMQLKSVYRVIIRVLIDLDFMDQPALEQLNQHVAKEIEDFIKGVKDKEKKEPVIVYKNPHKPLIRHYVDEFGNIVDEDGYVVYTDGTRRVEYVECDCECHTD